MEKTGRGADKLSQSKVQQEHLATHPQQTNIHIYARMHIRILTDANTYRHRHSLKNIGSVRVLTHARTHARAHAVKIVHAHMHRHAQEHSHSQGTDTGTESDHTRRHARARTHALTDSLAHLHARTLARSHAHTPRV